MKDCLFCKIVKGEIKTDFEYEDDLAVAFNDIHPLAPVHILIIPKEHIESINHLTEDEKGEKIAGRLILIAKKIAKKKKNKQK